MRIKFMKRWRSFKADRLADIADGAANILVQRGIAMPFPPPPGAEDVIGLEVDVDAKAPPKPERPEIEVIRDDQTKVSRPKRKTQKRQ